MTFGLHQHQSNCPNSMTGDAGIFFLTLINTLFTNQCQLGNKEDYPPNFGPNLTDNSVFDYIVIGAGTSGSVLASTLAKSSQNKVLLLEAGGYPSPTSDIPAFHLSLQKSVEDWQFHTEKSDTSCLGYVNGKCPIPSGKVLGGSSTINSMLYLRGNKHSYNKLSMNGNLGWAYQDILPHFQKLEKVHGKNGTIPLTRSHHHEPIRSAIFDSAKQLGHKVFSHENPTGFFEAPQTIHKGIRKNAARLFLDDFQVYQNLQVATEAFVEKIIIDSDVKEANGVRLNLAGNIVNVYADKEVILSAGPINSPKILMLSGIGPKEHLGGLGIETVANLKVGQNLQDHLMFPLFGIKLDSNDSKLNPEQELFKYFTERTGVLSGTGIGNLLGFISVANKTLNEAEIKLSFTLIPRQDSYIISMYQKNFNLSPKREPIKSLAEANKRHDVLLVSITLLNPKSKGRVELKSKNPHEKPLIFSGYLSEESDMETLVSGIRHVEDLTTKSEFFRKFDASLIDFHLADCVKYKFNTEDYWKCAIRNFATSGYNQIGTCKMGLSIDPTAVVDPLLRVHGVGKLRVVDSSIIPTSLHSDVGGAAFLIGSKGAEMISKTFQ